MAMCLRKGGFRSSKKCGVRRTSPENEIRQETQSEVTNRSFITAWQISDLAAYLRLDEQHAKDPRLETVMSNSICALHYIVVHWCQGEISAFILSRVNMSGIFVQLICLTVNCSWSLKCQTFILCYRKVGIKLIFSWGIFFCSVPTKTQPEQ